MLKNENLGDKIAEIFVDYGAITEAPNVNALNIPNNYTWKGQRPTYPSFDLRMHELGWGPVTPREFLSGKYQYIYDNNITAVFTNTVYHGSSAAFHSGIQATGLDSSKGKEINPGAMSVRDGGVCCTSSFSYADSYSKITVGRIVNYEDIDKQLNIPIVYRWNHHTPLSFGAVTASGRAINANELQFSIDGEKWYPADKFNITKESGVVKITPNYANIEIQQLAASLTKQNTSTANIFSTFGIDVKEYKNSDQVIHDNRESHGDGYGTSYENEDQLDYGYGTPYENEAPEQSNSGYGTPYENDQPMKSKVNSYEKFKKDLNDTNQPVESFEDEKDLSLEKEQTREKVSFQPNKK